MLGVMTVFAVAAQTALPFLSPVFGDHMVLQRDRTNTLWGWTTPGEPVTVTIQGRKSRGVADKSGKWMVKITPPPVGGPYQVSIDGPSHALLQDVLVGDVWICSGQSNMEMGVGLVKNAGGEIAAADHPGIRLFLSPHATSYDPIPVNPGTWAVCSPTSIAQGGWGGFSASAYFFGRELNRRLRVPIGLVQTCWGGTIAEAWTSRPGLKPMRDFDASLAQIEATKNAKGTPYSQLVTEWFAKNDPGVPGGWAAPEYDDSKWRSVGTTTNFDKIGLSKFDGMVWYRGIVDLPADAPTDGAVVNLGMIDDADNTWVNGKAVGALTQWNVERHYTIPSGVLKPGRNVVAVRVLDTGAEGGLYSPESDLNVKLSDGRVIPFGGSWKVQEAGELSKFTPYPQDVSNNPNVPTVLYNGMIAPLVPLAIRGAIWYQGESNADRAKQYQRLMPTLIKDWRKQWNQGDFPFFIVQLANYMEAPKDPSDIGWAPLREAQTLTTKKVKNTGLAVAIDIGDAGDIHPKDKQNVGYRLALAALKVAYGQEISYSGPSYRSMKVEGDRIRLSFDHVDNGLKLKAGDVQPHSFQVAGPDKKFYWATAQIDGNQIVVRAPDVAKPVAVRYAWASNPPANVYNGSDLPMVPFRTDSW